MRVKINGNYEKNFKEFVYNKLFEILKDIEETGYWDLCTYFRKEFNIDNLSSFPISENISYKNGKYFIKFKSDIGIRNYQVPKGYNIDQLLKIIKDYLISIHSNIAILEEKEVDQSNFKGKIIVYEVTYIITT